MSDLEANRKVIEQYWEAINRGDVAAAAEFFAEDTRNHGRPVGRAGVRMVLQDIQTTFPDRRVTPLQVVAEGEWVCSRTLFSGTHLGVSRLPVNGAALTGLPPTGRRMEVQHIHMMQVRDGKIVEHFANRDDLGMIQQLGVPLPTPIK